MALATRGALHGRKRTLLLRQCFRTLLGHVANLSAFETGLVYSSIHSTRIQHLVDKTGLGVVLLLALAIRSLATATFLRPLAIRFPTTCTRHAMVRLRMAKERARGEEGWEG